jgi:hypothetical protein
MSIMNMSLKNLMTRKSGIALAIHSTLKVAGLDISTRQ